MGALDGRIAIITGAGRGLGREHALLFAAEGAKVVVNDLGGDIGGEGADMTPAQETVQDIKNMGGEAVVNGDDVSDWEGAQRLVNQAVETFGGLDILVNNAGILRDRVLVNMTDAEWDSVIKVHLRGHFCPTRHAANYWRAESKEGRTREARVVNTASESGLFGNPGQANYAAAKLGICSFSSVISKELTRYGVKSNTIAPRARTRLTEQTPGIGEILKQEVPEGQFDQWAAANVSPFVAYLSTVECQFNGEVFFVFADQVKRVQQPVVLEDKAISGDGDRLTVQGIIDSAGQLA
ncbi:MAG: SDR family NAD(P)-dependent oxidoreductase [Acidimicrobiia bacterium]|nr:SDR family NAD(P)-dependent oxidoreductase [Acidimicrobiia bacterium]